MREKWHGEYKAPGMKLVVVDISTLNGEITEAQLSGDFFLDPDEAIFVISKSLLGLTKTSSIPEIKLAIEAALPEDAVLLGLDPLSIAIAVRRAFSEASRWRQLEWEIIKTPPLSPEMNVALDEVLTNRVGDGTRKPCMRIWEWNSDAIIIGSFQSVINEVDLEAARRHGARVLRRISGGGAMYMQSGASISYSVYLPTNFVAGMSFEDSYRFLDEWVVEALNSLGVEAKFEPLNDLTSPSGKIGGSAQKRLAKGSVLHHATLAYDMDGELMTEVLRIGREKISDKGIRSAAKRVDPLREQTGLTREEIMQKFYTVFKQRHSATDSELTQSELDDAKTLTAEKFLTDEWINRVS